MKQKKYTDGTPSREIEDDWEQERNDKMNSLHAGSKQKKSILDVRDRLCNLQLLLIVCREALSQSELNDIREIVTDVLYFFVEEQVKTAEQELANL